MGTGNTFWGYCGWLVNLTTHFYLEIGLKMNGNVLPILLYALVIWLRNALLYFVPAYVQFCSASPNEPKLLRESN
jgi:hypothetical protein